MGERPDKSHLIIFGSHVTSKIQRDRRTKLAKNVTQGIFLVFTATDKNITYQDSIINQIRWQRHVIFDKVFYNRKTRPTYAE